MMKHRRHSRRGNRGRLMAPFLRGLVTAPIVLSVGVAASVISIQPDAPATKVIITQAEPQAEAHERNTGISPETNETIEIQSVIEDVLKLCDREMYLLAKIAMAEAEDECTEGKALVICVVLNRVNNEEFPDNIEEVIFQKKQFSPVSNGRFDKVEPNVDCYEALDMVIKGWDQSQGALYFESFVDDTDKWHRENLEYLFTLGCHDFYK